MQVPSPFYQEQLRTKAQTQKPLEDGDFLEEQEKIQKMKSRWEISLAAADDKISFLKPDKRSYALSAKVFILTSSLDQLLSRFFNFIPFFSTILLASGKVRLIAEVKTGIHATDAIAYQIP